MSVGNIIAAHFFFNVFCSRRPPPADSGAVVLECNAASNYVAFKRNGRNASVYAHIISWRDGSHWAQKVNNSSVVLRAFKVETLSFSAVVNISTHLCLSDTFERIRGQRSKLGRHVATVLLPGK